MVDGELVQAFLPGTHHCVVAAIAYDEAPISTGVSPLSRDQLAQCNLQFTLVDNPGPEATHRAPQTFDIRPSKSIGTPGGAGLPPNELMIDWGDVPIGSTASIYWPAASATAVIALAQAWGGAVGLSSSDAHALTLKVVRGVSYIPIPKGAGQNFAGLFTVELPLGIRTGQLFEMPARRIASIRGKRPPPPPPLQSPPARKLDEVAKPQAGFLQRGADVERSIVWRYVVGAFVVRIPVSTGEAMRILEEMTLAIMKWRLDHLSPGNRWTPVLKRYIEYCSARLSGIGGDAAEIPPSLTWRPPIPGGGGGSGGQDRNPEVCGKVAEVLFDCHRAFRGFVLDECCEPRLIESHDRGLGELVLLACRENLTLCVRLCEDSDRLEGVAIRG